MVLLILRCIQEIFGKHIQYTLLKNKQNVGVSKMHTIHHKKYFHPLGANHLKIKFLRERSEHSAKKLWVTMSWPICWQLHWMMCPCPSRDDKRMAHHYAKSAKRPHTLDKELTLPIIGSCNKSVTNFELEAQDVSP